MYISPLLENYLFPFGNVIQSSTLADFTPDSSTVIMVSYPNPKPLRDFITWLVALACQQLDETEVRKWTFEVREPGNKKNQFVKSNHLGNGKKVSHRVENKRRQRAPILFFSFSSLIMSTIQKVEVLTFFMRNCDNVYVVIWFAYLNICCNNCGQ